MRHKFHEMPWTKPVLLALATLAFVIAPWVTPPFSGYEAGQFPVDIPDPAIQPAGYAFSIWAVIYSLLVVHAAVGLIWRRSDPAWDAVRVPLTVSIALGAVWLAIAGEAPLMATLAIWVMQAGALLAFLRADPGTDRWLLSAPIAMYAGWLTAAAAVSTGVVLAGYGLLSDTGSALAMLALVLVITLITQSRRPQMPVYAATVVWALAGIIVTNRATNTTVVAAALIGAVVVAAAAVWLLRRR